jgi:hypothetical protein
MNRVLRNTLCRLLIALMAWAPYQMSQAAMIGTDQVVSASSAQADRAHVMSILDRSEVASQLSTFGLDSETAKARVQAMTDEEVAALNNRLDALPAGAISDAGKLLVILIIIGVIWWAVGRPGMTR